MAIRKTPAEILASFRHPLLAKHPTWERVVLSKVAKVLNGYAFSSSSFSPDKGLPLIRIRDITSDTSVTMFNGDYDKQYVVQNGELLIGMDGDFRTAFWRGGKALLNQRVCKITLENDHFYIFKFLYYSLGPFLDAIHSETSSVTVKHLSSRSVEDIPLPLPPLNEQKRIVAKIEELFSNLDAGVKALEKAKELLKQYRQSVLKAAVTGELTKKWREKNKAKLEPSSKLLDRILKERRKKWEEAQLAAFKRKGTTPKDNSWKQKYQEPFVPDTSGLPVLSGDWVWSTLGTLAHIQGGVTIDQKRKVNDAVKLPYLRVANVQRGYFNLSEIKYVEVPSNEIEDWILRKGDVLFNEGGDRDKLGRGWVWSNQIKKCTHQNHVFRARPYLSELEGKFLSSYGNWVFRRIRPLIPMNPATHSDESGHPIGA